MNYYRCIINYSTEEIENDMEKRHSRFFIFLLPLALYVAIMFKMIENVYENDISKENELPFAKQNINASFHLQMLMMEYEQIELQRQSILENIDSFISKNYRDNKKIIVQEFSRDLHLSMQRYKQRKHYPNSYRYIIKPKYIYDCQNIPEIKLKQKIGHGVSKQTFLGEYGGNTVAVKMVTRHQKEVRTCFEENLQSTYDDTTIRPKNPKCFVLPTMKLMKEILLLEQLNNVGFLELLGYCVRNEESDSTDLSEHGVVAIYEPGQRFVADTLQYLDDEIKLNHAIHLAQFLEYLEYSPLGSLRVKDFKEEHFLFVKDTIKMIDLDDVDNVEPSCDVYYEDTSPEHLKGRKTCDFSISCHMGLCIGFNAKHNLRMMNKLFLSKLLKSSLYPENLQYDLSNINMQIDEQSISAENLVEQLIIIRRRLNKEKI